MHKKKAGKLQTGITFPKQYWLAVNGKPKTRRLAGHNRKSLQYKENIFNSGLFIRSRNSANVERCTTDKFKVA